ncbi:MAG: hypothetical protein RMJ88_16015 [Thermogemmata sp.]|nr:hypothetical protein [Thermogemmata sp.]
MARVISCPCCKTRLLLDNTSAGNVIECQECKARIKLKSQTSSSNSSSPSASVPPIRQEETADTIQSKRNSSIALNCPNCGRIDMVRKIGAILSQERRIGSSVSTGSANTFSAGTGGNSATLVGGLGYAKTCYQETTTLQDESELVRRLSPPSEPKIPRIVTVYYATIFLQ